MKIIRFIVALLILFNIKVYAANELPIYEEFNTTDMHSLTGWSREPLVQPTEKHYVRIENGHLAISVGKYDNVDSWPYLQLKNPIIGGKVTVEYKLYIQEGSTIISYHGLPLFWDSDKNRAFNMSFSGGKIGLMGKHYIDTELIKQGVWTAFKYTIDLDRKKVCLYINNEQVISENGVNEFDYKGNNLTRIDFCITSSTTTEAKVYIDDLCIYTDDRDIFVSNDGDDKNPGTYFSPVKTMNRAVEIYNNVTAPNKRIVLKSGEYALSGDYKYGEADIVTAENNIVLYPQNEASIKLSNVDLSLSCVNNMDIHDEYKDKFNKRLVSEFVSQYRVVPYTIKNITGAYDEEKNVVNTTITFLNKGDINYNITVINAAYENNKLVSVNTIPLTISAHGETPCSISHFLQDKNISYKVFSWDNLNNMRSIKSLNIFRHYYDDFEVINLSDSAINIKKEDIIWSNSQIMINGETEREGIVTVKVENEKKEVCYLRQFNITSGEFSLICNMSTIPEKCKIFVRGIGIDE